MLTRENSARKTRLSGALNLPAVFSSPARRLRPASAVRALFRLHNALSRALRVWVVHPEETVGASPGVSRVSHNLDAGHNCAPGLHGFILRVRLSESGKPAWGGGPPFASRFEHPWSG